MKNLLFFLFVFSFTSTLYAHEVNDINSSEVINVSYETNETHSIVADKETKEISLDNADSNIGENLEDANLICIAVRNVAAGAALFAGADEQGATIAGAVAYAACMFAQYLL